MFRFLRFRTFSELSYTSSGAVRCGALSTMRTRSQRGLRGVYGVGNVRSEPKLIDAVQCLNVGSNKTQMIDHFSVLLEIRTLSSNPGLQFEENGRLHPGIFFNHATEWALQYVLS